MLRSRHGRKGVNHGQIAIAGSGREPYWRQVLARWQAKRSFRPGLLRGRGPQPETVLLVAAEARSDATSPGPHFLPVHVVAEADRAARDARHRGRPGQRTLPARQAGFDPRTLVRVVELLEARRPVMLSLPPTVRIWLSAQPVDLRKSFDGLAALVRDGLRRRSAVGRHLRLPQQGRRPDQAPDLGGRRICDLVQTTREAEAIAFPASADGSPQVEVRAADLIMLLAGVDLVQRETLASAITAPCPDATA